ncbi:hypothetical protein [Snuella sedimenti]|uniref:Uncharacterized protein n=1 Tax=Snuella sedimenti TaxID=2798802 RepID=A0A8J7IN48_9FLAO|nr:hypothetical protein [Snuella sedimenti]MBJ6367737.1 hypothetical protein [Snuella sedimenti]
MKQKHLYILLGIALIITLIGLLTGKFFFLLLILPFGFGLFKKQHKNEDLD